LTKPKLHVREISKFRACRLLKGKFMKSMNLITVWGVLAMGLASAGFAETTLTPKAQLASETKKIAAAYEADKKLCNDEASSKARLQCRRDAKAEYDGALATAKAKTAATTPVQAPASVRTLCAECGKVVALSLADKPGDSSPLGVVAGGVAGAVLGHQVGGGTGKDLATIAGALGGAYAGKKIEEKVKTEKVWTVSVQYGDGHRADFNFSQDPGLKVGDTVKNSGSTVVRD